MKLSIKDKNESFEKTQDKEKKALAPKVEKEVKAEIKKELPKKAALVLPERATAVGGVPKDAVKKAKPWETKARKTEVVEEKPKEAPKLEAIAQKNIRKEGEYGAKDIQVLKGLEPVRLRPGMYIGSTGLDGLHHLIWEVVDNCLDEAMAGYAKEIEITLLPDNRVKISDYGKGIPV